MAQKDTVMVSRVHGCLASIAVGDALGFPAHDMTQEEVVRRFKGALVDLHDAFPDNPYHPGMQAGKITDDTTMTLVVAHALLDPGEPKDCRFFGAKLAEWARENDIWEVSPMYGPTTKASFRRLISDEDPVAVGTSGKTMSHAASNGAAMRVSPAGLVNPGSFSAAVEMAVAVSLPTHGTQVAIAGAAAIAAGVAEALSDGADVFSVASACLRGARQGEQTARKVARVIPAPSVALRIELAISAALKAGDILEAGRLITECVGNGLPTSEAVPAAVGLFVAAGGDPEKAVIGGANIGGDSDTIASMAGALAGALRGMERVPHHLYQQVEEINHLGLRELAEQLVARQR